MDYTKEILKSLNKPIYPLSISLKTHKIFLKYSNPRYRKYSLDLIKNLCQKLQFPNSESIFYQTLLYYDIILFNCGNDIIINNLDLLILNCFYISIKSLNDQYGIPSLKKLKLLIKDKFLIYRDYEIVSIEIECLKLLNYNINYMNVYDFLKFFISENNKILEISKSYLQNIIYGDIKFYIFKTPYELALEIFNKSKEKIAIKSLVINVLPTKKVVINTKINNYNRERNISIDFNKKLSHINNSICSNSTDFFSNENSTNGNLNNSPYNEKKNQVKFNTEFKRQKNELMNSTIIKNKTIIGHISVKSSIDAENNINQNISNKINSPSNISYLVKKSINIDLKYLSTISKKWNFKIGNSDSHRYSYSNTINNINVGNNPKKKLKF
jgi:hypothetical protein